MNKGHSIYNKFLAVALVFVLGIGIIFAGSDGFNTTSAKNGGGKLSQTKLTLIRTQKKKLKLKGTSKSIKWYTSNKKVIALKKSGKNTVLIKAKKAGKATIKAKAGNKIYTCKVTVKPAGLSKTKISLKAGKATTIKAIGSKKVRWSSSNNKVVTIVGSKALPKVRIRAKKAGTAYIRAKIGKKVYKCRVKVSGKSGNGNSNSGKKDNKNKKKNNVEKIIGNRQYKKHKGYSGTSYEIDFKKGDISVKIKPILVNKSLANEFRKEFNIPDSTKLYDQVEVSFTNNLNINNVMVPRVTYAYGTSYCITEYSNGTTKKHVYKSGSTTYSIQDSDARKEGSYDYIFLKKGQTKTFRMTSYYSGVKFLSYGSNDPIQVNIGSFYDSKAQTLKGLSFLYFPATGKTRETSMSEFSKNGYYCPYHPDEYH